jgi:hypothetical protein
VKILLRQRRDFCFGVLFILQSSVFMTPAFVCHGKSGVFLAFGAKSGQTQPDAKSCCKYGFGVV